MYWKVGDYHFDANTKRLLGESRDVVLEPKAAALLAYFCEHPGRSIGRDELLRTVWHGQVVSDNSINRVIVLLRKALGDDAKVRRYIATIPKLGYRLIADVAAMDRSAGVSRAVDDAARRGAYLASPIWPLAVAGLALAAVFLAFALSRSGPRSNVDQSPSIVPLSRLTVAQSNADLARDGQSLLYTASDGQWNQIYLVSGPDMEPRPVSASGGDADFAKWSHDGSFLVYRFATQDRCEFHRVDRADFDARSASVVYECVPGSFSEMSLSLDDATLYFVERATPTAPYAAYALDMSRDTKRRLSQPVARGYGNHYIDVHPRSGALLLLGDHVPGKTSVFELDPARDSFSLLKAFDYGLDSAIWSHRDGAIVHPSRHPSYQLVETPLNGDDSRVLVSDSRRIAGPRRIDVPDASGEGYLFTSYLYNRDIDLPARTEARLNSAVMDYLPALSSDTNKLAFVSKRAGYSQIWVKDFDGGRLASLTPPDSGRRFLSLAWSADDRRLLANTNTGILVYLVDEGAVLHDVALPQPAFGVAWHDAQTLSFSHYDNLQWDAYLYRLDSGETVALDERWSFSLRNDQQQLFFDQSLRPFRDGRELAELQACASPVWRYQMRYRLDGGDLYCHAADAYGDLLKFDAGLNLTRLQDVVERFEFFSVRDGTIARTRVASTHSDIMRTRQPP